MRAGYGMAQSLVRWAARFDMPCCLIWPFATNAKGYGRLTWEGSVRKATHVVLDLSGRPRPSSDHIAAHAPNICHNPSCISLQHLRWALPEENTADMKLDGSMAVGESFGRSSLTEEDVKAIRTDKRKLSELARVYAVSASTIGDIIKRRTWRHL